MLRRCIFLVTKGPIALHACGGAVLSPNLGKGGGTNRNKINTRPIKVKYFG